MDKFVGIAVASAALVAQMQMPASAQLSDQFDSKAQLQPPMTATADTSLRGPMTAQSAPPTTFTSTSSYSYKEPSTPVPNNYAGNAFVSTSVPVMNSAASAPYPSSDQMTKYKEHSFSPFNAALGFQDRAAKTSIGLADRTTKTGLGLSGKTAKELLKAIF